MENNQKQIAGAIVIAGVLIAGAILLKGSRPPADTIANPTNNNNVVRDIKLKPVSKEDHIRGSTSAKIVIVEYSDLECPFCKSFHQTMQQVIREDNKVAWVYRHYPIPALHQLAYKEAEATECAWEQGGNDAFWKFTDRIFEITPSNDGLDPAELPKIAQSLGLNVKAFNSCLESGKYAAKVQADIDSGIEALVNGTPSSFILVNGKMVDTIPGAQPLQSILDRLKALK